MSDVIMQIKNIEEKLNKDKIERTRELETNLN
jgi:hypothetical protein